MLAATLALTAFSGGGSPASIAGLVPAPASDLLPAGRPEPLVIAKVNGLRIHLPIPAARVSAIGYHGAGRGALALEPVGRQGNEGVFARLAHRIFGGGGAGPVWYQLPGGEGPRTSALDVGAAPGTEVYSPVDGTVVGVTPYVLNGRKLGSRVDVQPTSAPSMVVSMTHLKLDPPLSVGAEVAASATRLGVVIDLTGEERQALARYTNDTGNHLAIEVRPAATLALP